jgi:hypothetical protein
VPVSWTCAIREPSGDHVGAEADCRLGVRIVSGSPEAGMTKMCPTPPNRSDSNAIEAPSGDQVGDRSSPASVVSVWNPEPSGRIVAISKSSAPAVANAIVCSSGDHSASKSNDELNVTWVSSDPSWYITNSSKSPSRWLVKRILDPSGDHVGS